MSQYKETIIGEADTETAVLSALAEGGPFVFIVTTIDLSGELDIKVSVGNGVGDAGTLRNILEKTLKALPA